MTAYRIVHRASGQILDTADTPDEARDALAVVGQYYERDELGVYKVTASHDGPRIEPVAL